MNRVILFGLLLGILTLPAGANAHQILKEIGFDQRLNVTIPLGASFYDEQGQPVSLGQYIDGTPAILVLAYYRCPNLCGMTLEGVAESLKPLAFTAGKEYRVVVVSIDPEETPAIAAAKKAGLVERYQLKDMEQGWHFLTGDEPNIQKLARSVGFRYTYDPELEQYAHAAGITLLTGEGRIARYLYGVRFPVIDLRLGLIEASANRIGSPIDQLLLLCYHYDPTTGQYNMVVMNVLRLAGIATVAILGGFVGLMLLRERRPWVR